MPGKIKVKVLAGRNLPVMDRAGETTDAFVEIKFGAVTHKTDVCRKSLNPHWSTTEWYRFEVDESELQDEPLQLRLMDHDTYSANDAIGKVVISLAPLLAKEADNLRGAGQPGGAVMSGWIPVFDTMHGIRGELNIIVKVELFSDFNKYKTSSCGVQFFHCNLIPPGYRAKVIQGFVEELVVNDDPEYQWIDKIRTPRASNEARQVAFIKLSNQVQRLVGVKAAELGANAVLGYQQDFDLEGEAGVVARAIGTAVTIVPLPGLYQPISLPPCTQQQLRQYLDMLATDGESITDLNQYFQSHQDELKKLLNILNPKTPSLLDEPENLDEDEKSFDPVRQSSKSYSESVSIYQGDYVSQKSLRHISEDQTDLNKLLKGEENDSDSDSTGPIQKIKKIKTNFFSKRFGSNRSRKSDKQDDQVSIRSNSSDTSRLSLTDIKNELIKFKRLKKGKFRKTFTNTEDEGVGMASILARSVIHAHTSLACIAETQDSEHSPSSTMRRTSESEPTINMSDDDNHQVAAVATKIEIKQKRTSELHSSLKNINKNEIPILRRKLSQSCPSSPMTKRSQNFLTLPGETGYFESQLISPESSVYSSSDEDEDNSDQKTDMEISVETTSLIMRSVFREDSDVASQMNKTPSNTNNLKPDFKEIDPRLSRGQNYESESDTESDSSSSVDNNEKDDTHTTNKSTDKYVDTKVDHHTSRFRLPNPFSHSKSSKCVSAPSSPVENTGFVYRSSKHIKRQFSKISKSNMIKSLSHYSIIPKKKQMEPKDSLSQPGSSSNVPSRAPSETVLGSLFMSYADLRSLDKNGSIVHPPIRKGDCSDMSKVKMYIGSEPVSRTSISGPSVSHRQSRDDSHIQELNILKRDKPELKPIGLIHTAMETILMDKVQSLLVPTSPEPVVNKEKTFFDDVHKKLEAVEEARKIHHIDEAKQTVTADPHKHDTVGLGHLSKFSEPQKNKESMVKTAIETILIDNVQSLLPPGTPDIIQSSEMSDSNLSKTVSTAHRQLSEPALEYLATENSKPESLVQTAMKTMLIDKAQALLLTDLPVAYTSETNNSQLSDSIQPRNESKTELAKYSNTESLVQTAMKTMLIDKTQALLPTASEPVEEPVTSTLTNTSFQAAEDNKNNSVLYTALETILLDKVNSLMSTTLDSTVDTQEANENGNKKIYETSEGFINSITDKQTKDLVVIDESIKSLNAETSQKQEINTPNDINISSRFSLKKDNKLVRQDSIHSLDGQSKDQSSNISKNPEANIVIPCKKNHPVLQHFHPILSGAPLETIPSLPENSFEHSESLDIEGLEETNNDCESSYTCETNSASVCDNSHAACRFARSERDKEWSDERGEKESESPRHTRHESYGGREPLNPTLQQQHNTSLSSCSAPLPICRRSSDSDLSVTPKGGSLNASTGNAGSGGGFRPIDRSNLEMMDYPFLTMTDYPNGYIKHIGGTVCARSVKLLDGGGDSEARASWWAELRTELRSHARALRCNAVLAYNEGAAICEDVCVLSALGTAAVINLDFEFNEDGDTNAGSDSEDGIPETESEPLDQGSKSTLEECGIESCLLAHVPYSPGSGPNSAELSTCGGCKKARVPPVLLATCAKPSKLPAYEKAIALTAVATRLRKAPPTSEPGARDISDQLPFLEYELHKLLVAKLRMQGANALFSLQTQLAIGERYVMAVASGTAVRLLHLPPPTPPRVKILETDKDTLEIQKALWDTFTANKVANGYDIELSLPEPPPPPSGGLTEPEPEELPQLDLCSDKDAYVLQLDEAEEMESAKSLAVCRTHMQVYTDDVKPAPNSPPNAFAQLWRSRLVVPNGGGGVGGGVSGGGGGGSGGAVAAAAERHVSRVLETVAYKLRRLLPCAIAMPRLHIELPEDEIQLVVSGTAVPLLDPTRPEHNAALSEHEHDAPANNDSCNGSCHSNNSESSSSSSQSATQSSASRSESHSSSQSTGAYAPGPSTMDPDDDIFALDEEQFSAGHSHQNDTLEDRNAMIRQPPVVVMLTSLPAVSGARAARRLCSLRLLFVRETTAVRELGGLSGFLHTFTCEVLAIARAYTAALGGNALTSFYINQLMLQDNAHKNQGQCLLSVGGDVVQATF